MGTRPKDGGAGLMKELEAIRDRGTSADCNPDSQYSRDLLHSILETAPGYIVTISTDGIVLYSNRVAPGLELPEVIGASMYDLVAPEDRDRVRAVVERVACTAKPDEYEAAELVAGGRRYFHTRLGPLTHDGEVVAITLLVTDITEHKRVDNALENTQQKLRLAIDATQMGLWVWDKTQDSVTWDEVICRHFGIALEDAPQTYDDYRALIYPPDRDAVVASIGRCLQTGVYEDVTHRVQLPDGSIRWLLIKGALVCDDNGETAKLLGGVFDVTERRRLDDQLRHAQKMEAVGELAAGVAHNFNNMLTGVLSNLELAARKAPADIKPLLSDALDAGKRAADVVGQLVAFAGNRHVDQLRLAHLPEVVDRVTAMCRRSFDRAVALEVSCPDSLPAVPMHANHLEQALLNLVLNARDAMSDSHVSHPKIRIEVDEIAAESPELAVVTDPQLAPHLRIRVSDNGTGMSPETQSRVFEPFFTTKGEAQGTGLGLATAYATVREHRGWIGCESSLGDGTTFTILLPCSESAELPADQQAADTTPTPSAPATILLIDDEELVRNAVGRLLEFEGHRVLHAVDGADGLRKYKSEQDKIDVVLLDQSMPGLSGPEVLEQLVALDEDVCVILFTGYASAVAQHPSIKAVLAKPVRDEFLFAAIRDAIVD